MTVASTVAVGVADASKALDTLESDYSSAKAKIVAVVQAHIDANTAAAAAHQAEVDAAQVILTKALPSATPTATSAAAIILTSAGWVQRTVNFLGKNWRYVVAGVAVLVIGYGVHAGLVHI